MRKIIAILFLLAVLLTVPCMFVIMAMYMPWWITTISLLWAAVILLGTMS